MKSMDPEVSVIIPAHNTEGYIAEAIQSALGQTLHNIEVIVVDDASTDRTLAVAQSFTDKRLKILAHQQNLGAAAARNYALREAKGKWIAVLDSDDWYAPERLERLVQVAYEKTADMIADDLYYIKDRDKLPWSSLLRESGEQINKITQIDPVYFVTTDLPGRGGLTLGLTKPLIKRNFLEQHCIEYYNHIRLGQDFWFYLTCLAHSARFIFIPKPYYFYRSRPDSLVTINQVKRLDQYCNASFYFLEQDFIKTNPELLKALYKRLGLLEKSRPYFRVIDAMKHGQILKSLFEMVKSPYFFVHFIKQIPKILSRRIHYLIASCYKKNTNPSSR